MDPAPRISRPTGISFGELILEETENRCRGLCIKAVSNFAATRSWEAFVSALDQVDKDLASIVRHGGLVDGGWYPMRWYREVHRCLRSATGASYELCRRVGFDSVRHDLTQGVYKVVRAVATPEGVLRRAPWVFSRYIEHGTMTVTELGERHAAARFEHCVGFDRGVWEDVFGGCEAGLTVAGARAVKLRVQSGGRDGDTRAVVTATWNDV